MKKLLLIALLIVGCANSYSWISETPKHGTYYIHMKTRLTDIQLEKMKSKYNLTNVRHITKNRNILPSLYNVITISGNVNRQFFIQLEKDYPVILVEKSYMLKLD